MLLKASARHPVAVLGRLLMQPCIDAEAIKVHWCRSGCCQLTLFLMRKLSGAFCRQATAVSQCIGQAAGEHTAQQAVLSLEHHVLLAWANCTLDILCAATSSHSATKLPLSFTAVQVV